MHPHVAPLAPGVTLLTTPPRTSTYMNQPDQIWNYGESPHPQGVESGGALGPDPWMDVPTNTPHFVKKFTSMDGWQDHRRNNVPRTNIRHYVGHLAMPRAQPDPRDEIEASFELVAPAPALIGASQNVVVAIFTPPTFGTANPANFPQRPHAYPGNPNYHGLLGGTNGDGAHVDSVERNLDTNPAGYRVVGVEFAPRTSDRPMVTTMQRLRQVRRAAIQILSQPPYSIPVARLAFLVSGASFGGFTSALATVFYPDEFHASASGAYSGAQRSMPSDYDSFVFITSLLGLDQSGAGYQLRDAMEIPMWCNQEQTDFASVSFTNRWFRGHIQRPVYFLIGDEDGVTHGTDWIPLLKRANRVTGDGSLLESGTMDVTNVFGKTVRVFWSVVSKTCHGGDRVNVFTVDDGVTQVETNDLAVPLDLMIRVADTELRTNPGAFAITNALLGRKLQQQSTLPSLDPSRAALGHKGTRTGATGSLLTEHPPFQRYGQGTWLGTNESLKVKPAAAGQPASVYVGSADGFVTRLEMQTLSVGGTTIQPLVEVQRTKKGNPPVPYALGHGTWGLDVGDVDSTRPGLELVVAAYDRIGIFDAVTLEWILEINLPSWEYTNPRKLQVANLVPGADEEIVFRTLHGHLVIMGRTPNTNYTILYDHAEGGIIDLAIGPTPTPRVGSPLLAPVYLLSARGHVVRLDFDQSQGQFQAAFLAGASHLEFGGLRDLDVVTFQGQQQLAALCVHHLGVDDAIRIFSAVDCTKIASFGDIQTPLSPEGDFGAPHTAPSGDMEPSFTFVKGHGPDRYVVSSGGDLSVWDGVGNAVLGHKTLGTFVPASGHGCVQAGEIDASSLGEEVVVATSAGRVVWFRLSDLTTPGTSLASSPEFPPSRRHLNVGGVLYEHRCNTSLAATWAMSGASNGTNPGKLHAVDPNGTWWEVDPNTGTPAQPIQTTGGALSLVDAKAPNGFPTQVTSGGAAHLAWQLLPPTFGVGLLWSSPYVPDTRGVVPPPQEPWQPLGRLWWIPTGDARAGVLIHNRHWLFPFGGASYVDATGRRWCAWWHNYAGELPLVQCVTYDLPGGVVAIRDIWGSTQGLLPGNVAPPRWPPSALGYLRPLRTELDWVVPMNLHTIKIGRVLAGRVAPQVIVSAMGGRVMLLDGITGLLIQTSINPVKYESNDFGLGGLAMAVADLDGDQLDEVIFASVYSPIDGVVGGTVRSHLHVFTGRNGLLEEMPNTSGVKGTPIGIVGNDDFLGYGACGLAIIDHPLITSIQKGILVTTLNGEIAVFAHTNGAINPTAVFRKVVEGSVGAFNSIVIEDLDPSQAGGFAKPELYVAGSSGIRRFNIE